MTAPPRLRFLFDHSTGLPLPLPPVLRQWYGPLRFPPPTRRPSVVANFVSTLDGVVAFGGPRGGGSEISGGDPNDRMLMGLLRAAADAVIVGAGTLRSVPRHVWTPEYIAPDLHAEFSALRRRLGKPAVPMNVIVSASGELDLNLPVFQTLGVRALVVSTRSGSRKLAERDRPPHVEVHDSGEEARVSAGALYRAVQRRLPTADLLLVEGGPHLLGDLLSEGMLDELFLTLAPQLAGRVPGQARLGLVEGRAFGPEHPLWSALISAKRSGDHLFLRYGISPATTSRGGPVPSKS